MSSWQVPKLATAPAAVAQKERALISQRTKDALKGRVLSGASLRRLTLESEKAIVEGARAIDLAQQYGVSRQATTEAVRRYKAVREERA